MTDEQKLDPEMLEAISQKTFGMPWADYAALSMEEKVQVAYDRGLGFAAPPGLAAVGHDGQPVTEQEAKVLRPEFGKSTERQQTDHNSDPLTALGEAIERIKQLERSVADIRAHLVL